jgi:hypothetical protein
MLAFGPHIPQKPPQGLATQGALRRGYRTETTAPQLSVLPPRPCQGSQSRAHNLPTRFTADKWACSSLAACEAGSHHFLHTHTHTHTRMKVCAKVGASWAHCHSEKILPGPQHQCGGEDGVPPLAPSPSHRQGTALSLSAVLLVLLLLLVPNQTRNT